MAITVGTNSYLTLAEFKTQADLLARDYSGFTDQQIEGALVESSLFYIDPTFTFKGTKIDDTQPMSLPTDQVSISDISKGAFQAAWQMLNGELFTDPASGNKSGIKRERKKLASLETETEYKDGVVNTGYTFDTTRIQQLLKPYLATGFGGGLMASKGYS